MERKLSGDNQLKQMTLVNVSRNEGGRKSKGKRVVVVGVTPPFPPLVNHINTGDIHFLSSFTFLFGLSLSSLDFLFFSFHFFFFFSVTFSSSKLSTIILFICLSVFLSVYQSDKCKHNKTRKHVSLPFYRRGNLDSPPVNVVHSQTLSQRVY